VLSAAVDFLIEALIRAVTPRIIALFNPAGALVQAVEVIYRILAWVFDNAARIFTLVETVVNGAAQLVAGNTAGMAAAVEGALARIIAPVIDFLAGFLGLGDLPERIADTIRSFQEMVLAAIDRVVGFIAERARALLRALGLGGAEDEEEDSDEDLTNHTTLANRVKRDMERSDDPDATYQALRTAKEAQARQLETQYNAYLEDGIGLSINFQPASADAADEDIDFEVVIAPNTTNVSGNIGLGSGDVEKIPVESWIKNNASGGYERVTHNANPIRRTPDGERKPMGFNTSIPDGGGAGSHSYSKEGQGDGWERTNFTHGSGYVMPSGSGADFVLKPQYQAGTYIRSSFYGDSQTIRTGAKNGKLPGLTHPTRPNMFFSEAPASLEARFGFPVENGRAVVPKSQASADHDPAIADHWTNHSGNRTTQGTYKIMSGRANSSLGSRSETYTIEVGIGFRGPGE
jgi:hypothetical protein